MPTGGTGCHHQLDYPTMSVGETLSGDDGEPVTGILVVGATDRTAPYLAGLPTQPLARIAGIFDPSPERVRHAARWTGDVPCSSDLEEALSWPGVDACIVGAPLDHAGDLGETLAEARKHVLMIDPPARSEEDARRLQDRFVNQDLVLMAATPHRFSDHATTVRAEVDRGRLGRIVFVRLALLGDPEGGEGAFDLVSWWIGEPPSSVYALQRGPSSGYLSVTLSFAGGATAICEMDRTGDGLRRFRHVYVLGTEGALEMPWSESPNLVIEPTGAVGHPGEGGDLHRLQLGAWLAEVRDRNGLGTSIESQMRALAVAEATRRSLASGDIIPLDPDVTLDGAG